MCVIPKGNIKSTARQHPASRRSTIPWMSLVFTIVVLWMAVWSPAEAGERSTSLESTGQCPALVYKLAADAVLPILPVPLQDFLSHHANEFRRGYLPDFEPNALGGRRASDHARHHVYLDLEAADGDASSRRDAARRFPRRRADARRLYERLGGVDGGSLPWLIEEEQARLVAAFESDDSAEMARRAGYVLHLCADAAMPFNTTALARDLNPSGSPETDAGRADDALDAHISVRRGMRLRDRFHGALIVRLQERLAYEVRVSPCRLIAISDPLEAAFHTLISAHAAAEELIALDADVVRELQLDDVHAFVASADVYWTRLAERSAPILEHQIEAGALLGANLITAAWVKAGCPQLQSGPARSPEALPEILTPSTVPADPKSPEIVETGETHLVGSLSSTVYHRANCSHCARIKPENTVRFASPSDAESAGRKPCRACKPDVPQ